MQVFKFIYAQWLADLGLLAEAEKFTFLLKHKLKNTDIFVLLRQQLSLQVLDLSPTQFLHITLMFFANGYSNIWLPGIFFFSVTAKENLGQPLVHGIKLSPGGSN